MDSKRFILALALSVLILVGWSFLFPPKPIQSPQDSAQTGQTAQTGPTPDAAASPGASPSQPSATPAGPATTPDAVANTTIHVSSSLYDVKFDSKGAVVTSWILKEAFDPEASGVKRKPLLSVGGSKQKPLELELIPSKDLLAKAATAPLQVTVPGDDALNSVLRDRNYKLVGSDANAVQEVILAPGFGTKRIEFVLHDDALGLDVVKAITFREDRYDVDIEVKLMLGGQVKSPVRLCIGPSIGDQGIKHFSFYTVAPEGISVVDGSIHRLVGPELHAGKEGGLFGFFRSDRPEGIDQKNLNGTVDWAGIGDTYFAMMLVPAQAAAGLQFKSVEYEHGEGSAKEKRYLVSAFVPIAADGSRNSLYVGTKDHYLLNRASADIRQIVNREPDLEVAIDYGFLGQMSRWIAKPILLAIKKLYGVTGNYGVAIILLTVVIYSLFFPLKLYSSRSMKSAQKHAPRMKEVQEQMKGMKQDDPRLPELQREQFRLMKEANMLGGCLPLLIQMPFLFALYRAITISIDFRQATFLWIPDLSAPEPYLIHLLPILMASSMLVLQLITPAPQADPVQRKMMAVGMPVFMLWVLWSAPCGLLVYWLVGNVVGFAQQFIINRMIKSEGDKQPPTADTANSRSSKKLDSPTVSQA